MIRTALLAALTLGAVPALADSKAQSCQYQADVVSAVQAARVARVAERNVEAHILASEPTWPAQYNNAIPLVAPWVYEQKRRDLKTKDFGAAWNAICLAQ
ncbi:MAG: hypothetical protein AAGF60_15435 [Pseudomonadota bacterium]